MICKLCSFSFLYLLFQFLYVYSAIAADENLYQQDEYILGLAETFQIDGKEITREDFAKTFIEAVSVPITYNPHNLVPKSDVEYDAYPWFYSHVYPEKGLPRSLAVNKWVKDIRVSFGLPYDMKPFNAPIIDGKRATDYETWPVVNKRYIVQKYFARHNSGIKKQDDFDVLEKEVKETAKVLDELLPVSVSYQDFETETPEEYGNVRIVLFEINSKYYGIDSPFTKRVSDNQYKVDFHPLGETYKFVFFNAADKTRYVPKNYLFHGYDQLFRSRGLFTEYSKKQVAGYILPNENNEIEMAFCYIWVRHKTDVKRGLIRECLVRSLGLVNQIKTDISDGFSVFASLYPYNQNSYKEWLSHSFSLPQKDEMIVKTLYNSEIRPGSDYLELNSKFSN